MMEAFSDVECSPVTLSKRAEIKLTSKPYSKAPAPVYAKPDDGVKRLIRDCFDEMVVWYAETVKLGTGRKSKDITRDSASSMPLLRFDTQKRTQAEMHDLCRIIRSRGQLGASDYTGINLNDLTQSAHGFGFARSANMEISLKPVGGIVHRFRIHRDSGFDAVIIAGETGGATLAFLVVKRDDGEECFFELEYFSMLSVYYRRKDEHGGFFTVFNREPSVLYCDYCTVYPKGKLRLLDIEDAKSKELNPANSDGTGDTTD